MKLKTVYAFAIGSCAALAIAAGPASAAVTFDPFSGTGFVGKGDVQLAFGWNNKALQANATGVRFAYVASTSYEAVCSFTTGEGTRGEKTHDVEHTSTTGVSAVLDGDPRQTKGQTQFTGFVLNGFLGEPVTTGGSVPVVGGPCPGNQGHDGVWSAVTPGATSGGLTVTHGGTTVPLAVTPVV